MATGTFSDLLEELDAHLVHCRHELETTLPQASTSFAYESAFTEEINTLGPMIPALELLQGKVNEIIAYLAAAELKLKVGGLPEPL